VLAAPPNGPALLVPPLEYLQTCTFTDG
jgi:hypothetical protein